MAEDPETSPENPMFTMVSQPGIGEYPMASTPIAFSAAQGRPVPMPPRLGEHTDAILKDLLGLSTDEVAALRSERVVGEPAGY